MGSSKTVVMEHSFHDRLQFALSYSDAERQSAEQAFQRCYPEMQRTSAVDTLRRTAYQRLDEQGQVYLDYTGGGLYAQTQIDAHLQQLTTGTFGNPHSANPTSIAATELVNDARAYVYDYFNADPDEYIIVFTTNASGALKLIGESYPFDQNGQYLLTFDNHNSVNGIREYARYHNAPVTYSPITLPELRIDADTLRTHLASANPDGNNLFAFPAQSNFSGVQHPLEWIAEAQALGWDVLLDSAAFVPTNRLDLSKWKPDFVPLSFYKMFGYPTGVGALFIRRDKLAKLRRPWFAGGTVEMVSALTPKFVRADAEAAFEDGTVNYLNIPAVEIGLRHLTETGIDCIHERVMALTGYLLDEMLNVTHSNGQPLVSIYGPTDTHQRGATIAFNLLDPNGQMFDVRLVETLANEAMISLRTGCFCNPGAGENAFHLTVDDVEICSTAAIPVTYEHYIAALTAHTGQVVTGAIRISLGIASNFADVHHFVRFLSTFVDLESPGFMG
ncbi:MAG: aminotransferase class V-fold PLP-dependent enzyme [Aggregatilineales bacterium]